MSILNTFLVSGTTNTQQASGASSSIFMLISIGLLVVVMYFMMIRPQRKKEKKEQAMRDAMQIGDEVITIGGIIGMVVSIKDDSVVIETGGDRSKIRVKKFAISTVVTVHE